MKITATLKREIETDIKLCNEYIERNGSMSLYNDLVAKYVVIDPNFEKGLSVIGKKHFTNLSAILQTIFILSEKIIFQTELRSMQKRLWNGYYHLK